MKGMFKALLLGGVAGVVALPAGAQAAEGAESDSGGVIVVTARKRDESVQDVPVSVTVISGEELIRTGAQDFGDFMMNNPNVKLTPIAGSGGLNIAPAIRGNVNASSILVVDASVGVYVDDFIFAHTWGTLPLTVDIESVQTLKGPQGTLFGRNTTGGAMLIKTVDPKLGEVEGFVRGEASLFTRSPSNKNFRLGGAINIPLADNLAARAAVQYNRVGNYETLTDGRSLGEEDRFLGRIKVLWEPSSTTHVIATAEYAHEKVQGTILDATDVDAKGRPLYTNVPSFIDTRVGTILLPSDPLTDRERKEYKAAFFGLKVIQDLPNGGNVKLIVGHRHYSADTLNSVPRVVGPSLSFRPSNDETSLEVQVNTPVFNGAVDLSAGVFIYDEDLNDNTQTYGLDGRIRPASTRFMSVSATSKSAYLQGTLHATDWLNFTLGGRVTNDRKSAEGFISVAPDTPAASLAEALALPPATFRSNNTKFNYLIGADVTPTDGVLLYATHSTGYRSGGPQIARLSNDPTNALFTRADFFLPESIKNYEGGVKLELFDRVLTVNGAVFLQNYKGYQYQGIDPATVTRIAFNVDAKIKGFELDATVRLPTGTRISANVGHTDALLNSGPSIGERLPDVSRWDYGVTASHTFVMGSGELDVTATYAYLGDFSTNVEEPLAPGGFAAGRVPGRGLLNASITYSTGPISVALFGNNLTDKKYRTHVRNVAGGLVSFDQLGKPRQVGVRFGYNF